MIQQNYHVILCKEEHISLPAVRVKKDVLLNA